MQQLRRCHQRKHHGQTDSVVRSQAGSPCRQGDTIVRVPIEIQIQRILGKVMDNAFVLYTHHVHMSLKEDCRGVLISLRCRHTH